MRIRAIRGVRGGCCGNEDGVGELFLSLPWLSPPLRFLVVRIPRHQLMAAANGDSSTGWRGHDVVSSGG